MHLPGNNLNFSNTSWKKYVKEYDKENSTDNDLAYSKYLQDQEIEEYAANTLAMYRELRDENKNSYEVKETKYSHANVRLSSGDIRKKRPYDDSEVIEKPEKKKLKVEEATSLKNINNINLNQNPLRYISASEADHLSHMNDEQVCEKLVNFFNGGGHLNAFKVSEKVEEWMQGREGNTVLLRTSSNPGCVTICYFLKGQIQHKTITQIEKGKWVACINQNEKVRRVVCNSILDFCQLLVPNFLKENFLISAEEGHHLSYDQLLQTPKPQETLKYGCDLSEDPVYQHLVGYRKMLQERYTDILTKSGTGSFDTSDAADMIYGSSLWHTDI